MRLVLLALLLLPAILDAQSRWYRGNTHAHTLRSDGDSPPDSVARWYRDHGYAFLFITDHETLTDPAPLNAAWGVPGKFLLIQGQEVTQRVTDSSHAQRVRQAHVNALGAASLVLPLGTNGLAAGITMREGYARNVAAIRAAGGVAQVNHPNFRWSVRLADLADLPDSTLIEIWNAHTGVNNAGADGVPSTEALWDSLLTRGRVLFAVADDDSHSFRAAQADDQQPTRPGRAWIMVRADTLTADAILAGIRRGDFYSSTGVTLTSLERAGDVLSVAVQPAGDTRYTIEFVGRRGQVLARKHAAGASYRLRGDEGYVRARVTDSNGRQAFTQPFR